MGINNQKQTPPSWWAEIIGWIISGMIGLDCGILAYRVVASFNVYVAIAAAISGFILNVYLYGDKTPQGVQNLLHSNVSLKGQFPAIANAILMSIVMYFTWHQLLQTVPLSFGLTLSIPTIIAISASFGVAYLIGTFSLFDTPNDSKIQTKKGRINPITWIAAIITSCTLTLFMGKDLLNVLSLLGSNVYATIPLTVVGLILLAGAFLSEYSFYTDITRSSTSTNPKVQPTSTISKVITQSLLATIMFSLIAFNALGNGFINYDSLSVSPMIIGIFCLTCVFLTITAAEQEKLIENHTASMLLSLSFIATSIIICLPTATLPWPIIIEASKIFILVCGSLMSGLTMWRPLSKQFHNHLPPVPSIQFGVFQKNTQAKTIPINPEQAALGKASNTKTTHRQP